MGNKNQQISVFYLVLPKGYILSLNGNIILFDMNV